MFALGELDFSVYILFKLDQRLSSTEIACSTLLFYLVRSSWQGNCQRKFIWHIKSLLAELLTRNFLSIYMRHRALNQDHILKQQLNVYCFNRQLDIRMLMSCAQRLCLALDIRLLECLMSKFLHNNYNYYNLRMSYRISNV